MRYLVLACDFDGTVATDGSVRDETFAALQRLRDSGRKLILVTGREVEDLLRVFPRIDIFDRVVAENGALLYRPANREHKTLGEAPPAELVKALRGCGISPLSVGHCIVSTWQPHESKVLETIRDLGLELQVIFNKGAVMILPSGVNKATGLDAALLELGLSPHNCVGVGDAENDHALIRRCECGVAVANALPLVRERADWVTPSRNGEGVVELIDKLIAGDLADLEGRLSRHSIPVGTRAEGDEVRLDPYGLAVLVAGSSGSGKSTFATGFLERLAVQGYQFCIVDPEGDYALLEGSIVLGDKERPPTVAGALEVLEQPNRNVVVNLLGLALAERPAFFSRLLPGLQDLRSRTGRPHWIVVDEAHHLLPAPSDLVSVTLPRTLSGMMLVTVHPEHVSPAVLASIDIVLAIGRSADETLRAFGEAVGAPPPATLPGTAGPGEALLWRRRPEARDPVWVRTLAPKSEHRRHVRKYATGELGEDKSFYFRGPAGQLNLRAQNLALFIQLAEGVDDETWLHHLQIQDYSRWFREAIKDEDLAAEAAGVERQTGLAPGQSRELIKAAIERRYTMPS
ncbi:MAG TPA: HAD-IIB family hydrolase [Candidatus Acidoferrales bacterium]|nr:HAD-IIB family hydrolase [Candidatus Acidoferrales bacterium]